jgi:hypothetical protein
MAKMPSLALPRAHSPMRNPFRQKGSENLKIFWYAYTSWVACFRPAAACRGTNDHAQPRHVEVHPARNWCVTRETGLVPPVNAMPQEEEARNPKEPVLPAPLR